MNDVICQYLADQLLFAEAEGFCSPPTNLSYCILLIKLIQEHSSVDYLMYLTQVSQHSTWKLWCNSEYQRETSWILPCYYGDTEFTAKADPWNQCC